MKITYLLTLLRSLTSVWRTLAVELSVYYTLRFLIGIQGISEVDTGNNSIYLDKEVIIVYDLIFMHANNTLLVLLF